MFYFFFALVSTIFKQRGFTRVSAYIDWIRTNANEKNHKSSKDNETLSLELSSYAVALNKLGRLDEAHTKADEALALNARNQMAISQKVEARDSLKYKRSQELNQQAIDLSVTGDYEKANELFESAYKTAPISYIQVRSNYRLNQAFVLNMLTRYREALIKANESLRLNFNNKGAHDERSVAERGLSKQAFEWNSQGLVRFKAEEFSRALEYFDLAARSVSNTSKTRDLSFYLANQAHALVMLSRYDEALSIAKQTLRFDSQNEHAKKLIAEVEARDSAVTRTINSFGWIVRKVENKIWQGFKN